MQALGSIQGPVEQLYSFPIGNLAPGVQAWPLTIQLLFVGYDSSIRASGMARVVVLDSAF